MNVLNRKVVLKDFLEILFPDVFHVGKVYRRIW